MGTRLSAFLALVLASMPAGSLQAQGRSMESPVGEYEVFVSAFNFPMRVTYQIHGCLAVRDRALIASLNAQGQHWLRCQVVVVTQAIDPMCSAVPLHDALSQTCAPRTDNYEDVIFGRYTSSFLGPGGVPAMDNWFASFLNVYKTFRLFITSNRFLVQAFTASDPTVEEWHSP